MTHCCDGGAPGKAVHDICKMCHYWMPLAAVSPQTGAQHMTKEHDIAQKTKTKKCMILEPARVTPALSL